MFFYGPCFDDDITFRKFAIDCSKEFGAPLKYNWGPSDIPKCKADEEACEKYNSSLKEKEELLEMTEKELLNKSVEDYDHIMNDYNEKLAKAKKVNQKYKNIKNQAQSWNPPTADHQCVKDHMLETIEAAIEASQHNIDFIAAAKPTIKSPQQWKECMLQKLQNDIEEYKLKYDMSIEKMVKDYKWERQLLESLEQYKDEK